MSDMDVQVLETDVVLFPVGSSKENELSLTEETEINSEAAENKNNESSLKSKFARLKRSMRKRALGIL